MASLAGTALIAALATASLPSPGCGLVRTEALAYSFATVESAVHTIANARLASSVDEDREWVGGVLRTMDGRYLITEGAGCPGQDTVTFAVPLLPRSELVAFWHTHGGRGMARSYFSAHDAQVVAQTGKDFYLMTPRGELKVLTAVHARVSRVQYAGARVDTDHVIAFEV